MVRFLKKEVNVLLVAAFVLGLVFGYDDGSETFQLSYWLTNFVMTIVLSFLSIAIYDAAHKAVAKKLGCESIIKIWSMKRFNLATSSYIRGEKMSLPLGAILPLLFVFVSGGILKFAAITSTAIISRPAKRLGRKFAEVTDFEEAKIAVAGPLVALLVALLAKAFLPSAPFAHQVIAVNLYLALSNMLPIPTLDGLKVYFGSPLTFTFMFMFTLGIFFLINIFSPIITLLLSLILAVVMFFFVYTTKFVNA